MNQCSEGECMFQLKTKQNYIRLLESLKKIAVDIGFSIEKIEKLGQTLSNYELLIPVVGEFSAGKSCCYGIALFNGGLCRGPY